MPYSKPDGKLFDLQADLDRVVNLYAAEWYIIARDRAKLGAKWRPAYQRQGKINDGFLSCPQCGLRLVDDKCVPLVRLW